MAVYFKYFCAGNYRFSWEYLSSKGVSAHIALTFTLFHTRVRAMRLYISLVVNCAQMSSIAFAASQLNPLSIVFLFKLLFTPKPGIEVLEWEETRYSEIDDQELDVFVRTILALLPNSGEVMIQGALRGRGVRI